MESDCESNTSVIPLPYEYSRVHVSLLKSLAPSAPPLSIYEEESYFRPDYGIKNVILSGKWGLYPTLKEEDKEESCSIVSPSTTSESRVIIEDNSLIREGNAQNETDPLITTIRLCKSCKRKYTTKTRHNYFVIILLFFIALLSTYSLFPWGIVGFCSLLLIPKFLNVPTCKKCRRKWC